MEIIRCNWPPPIRNLGSRMLVAGCATAGVARKSEWRAVDLGYSLVEIGEGDDRHHGREDFLAHDAHPAVHVGENRWMQESALPAAAFDEPRALRNGFVDPLRRTCGLATLCRVWATAEFLDPRPVLPDDSQQLGELSVGAPQSLGSLGRCWRSVTWSGRGEPSRWRSVSTRPTPRRMRSWRKFTRGSINTPWRAIMRGAQRPGARSWARHHDHRGLRFTALRHVARDAGARRRRTARVVRPYARGG